jgi:hypothetical protein
MPFERVIEPELLAKRIVTEARALFATNNSPENDGEWTDIVMMTLARIARSLNNFNNEITPIYHHLDGDKKISEFLWDHVWWQKIGNKQQCALVAESEWRGIPWRERAQDYADAVSYDFEKLLCAKSPLKVFIYSSHEKGKKDTEDSSRLIEDVILEHLRWWNQHVEGETYIIIDFRNHRIAEDHDRAYLIPINERCNVTLERFPPSVLKSA